VDPLRERLPYSGEAVKTVPRVRYWKVQKDREVFLTPDGPVIAEKGSVVAIAVGDSFEDTDKLLKALDAMERKE
jgi:hypothetical protein